MTKRKAPRSKDAPAGQPKSPGTESEIEPVSPERSAKQDKNFKTIEPNILKNKKSVPPDSTAQRGKSPISTSKEEKEQKDSEE